MTREPLPPKACRRCAMPAFGPRRAWFTALLLVLSSSVGAAQSLPQGPGLAPLTPALGPQDRADGTADRTPPPAARAPALIDATPEAPVGPGGEATLLADMVTLTGERQLEASGGVVVWYQGTRLVAPRILYDGAADRLLIEGPIQLSRPQDRGTDREAVLVADAAALDGALRAGLLRGARLVLGRELQLAAREVRLSDGPDGRITVLDRVAASACRVCAGSPTPLWEIRARRITHNSATRRLTFERPQFRAFGLPVAAVPFTISAPDPTVERMTGFLQPEIRTTSKLGFGVKTPWFRTLGDSADLTLTPYLAFDRSVTLDARYRRVFADGALIWRGGLSRDGIKDDLRGYTLAAAEFRLPDGFTLGAQLQWASDRDYLEDYGITDADRLWSGVTLQRITRDQLIWAEAGSYRTLREGEDQDLLPTQVTDGLWVQRLRPPPAIGGQAVLSWGLHGHRRPSSADAIGRDVARASATADWQRSWVLPSGVLAKAQARLDADIWRVSDDTAQDRLSARATPTLGMEVRWPLIRASAGATDMIEPVLALAWSPHRHADTIPNEDSLFPELDEGNLYALDRLPGRDRAETGLRAAVGLGWTRILPQGGSIGVTLGRLWRENDEDRAGVLAGASLAHGRADWLLAANLQRPDGLAAVGRALIDEDGDVTSGEVRLGWIRPDLQLSAGYAFAAADATAAATSQGRDLSQLGFDTGWQVADGWWARATGRYDLDLQRAQRAAFGVTYRNECITVEAAVNRDWDRPGGDAPDTGFDLSVRLGGFGRSQTALPGTVARRSCLR